MEFSLSKIALLLLLPVLGLFGCQPGDDTPRQTATTDLMQSVQAAEIIAPQAAAQALADTANSEAAQDFSLAIFHHTLAYGENSLTSPLSVLYALGMTANGAAGETLSQMEQTLGLPAGQLNYYLAAYSQLLAEDELGTLQTANSIWLRDDPRLTVEQAFLQTNAQFYQAGIYTAPFDDATVKAINQWVSDHTNQMIPAILDRLSNDTVMCLLNAVAFDGEWASPYEEFQVRPGDFTTAGGATQQVDFMYDTEFTYLEDANCTGFLRYYKRGRYAFGALLPNADVDIWNWAAQLDGRQLRELLRHRQDVEVHSSIPKFAAEYSVDMTEILQAMGMTDAFNDGLADFSPMASSTAGNIFISAVLHKARIDVNEQGTKAGAATVVMMADCAAAMPMEYKEVYLDRPFVYMLLDTQTELPIFLGICANVK